MTGKKEAAKSGGTEAAGAAEVKEAGAKGKKAAKVAAGGKQAAKEAGVAKPFNKILVAVAVVAVCAIVAAIILNPTPTGNVSVPNAGNSQPVVGDTSTFTVAQGEIEVQDGKPVVRLFSTTWCPHCKWINEAFEETMKEYEGRIVAMHWEIDIGDDTLTEEKEAQLPQTDAALFRQGNAGGSIPFYVFGKRYYRVGNGYEDPTDFQNPNSAESLQRLEQEKAAFRAAIEALLQELEE